MSGEDLAKIIMPIQFSTNHWLYHYTLIIWYQ